jgi:hypothetical protein
VRRQTPTKEQRVWTADGNLQSTITNSSAPKACESKQRQTEGRWREGTAHVQAEADLSGVPQISASFASCERLKSERAAPAALALALDAKAAEDEAEAAAEEAADDGAGAGAADAALRRAPPLHADSGGGVELGVGPFEDACARFD